MKTICIMNLKGGVGKSVTAVNLSAIFALLHGKRVLLIDADYQGNTSKFYRADQEGTTLREVLLGEAELCWPASIQRTAYEGLDILPADMRLAELDAAPDLADSGAVWRLRELLECIAEDDAYDFVVVDMPSAFSLSARAALAAADEVIVPIKLDAFSIDGMAELLRQIASMRRVNPGLTLAGVLITMWHKEERIMRMYKTGDLCPCCGQPIRHTDPEQLRLFSILAHVMGLGPSDGEDSDEEDAPVAGR